MGRRSQTGATQSPGNRRQQTGSTLAEVRSELGGKNRWDTQPSAFDGLNMGADNSQELSLLTKQAQMDASRAEQDKNAEFWGNAAQMGLSGLGTVAGGIIGGVAGGGAGALPGATIGGGIGTALGGLASGALKRGMSAKADDPAYMAQQQEMKDMQLKKAREAALMQAIGMLR